MVCSSCRSCFGTVIRSIFDTCHCEVLWTGALTSFLWCTCTYVHLILYIMLHSTNSKPSCQMQFIACTQQYSAVHSWLRSIAHSQPAWLTLPNTLSRCSPVLSENPPQYTSEYALKYTSEYTLKYTSKYTLKYSSKYAPKYSPKHALKYPSNCTRWHTPSLLECTLLSKLSRHSQVHLWVHAKVRLRIRAQVHLRVCSKLHRRVAVKYPPEYALKCTPKYPLQYAPNCTPWHTPILLGCTHRSTLSSTLASMLLTALDCTLPVCMTVRSQVRTQVPPNYARLNLPACLAVRFEAHSQEVPLCVEYVIFTALGSRDWLSSRCLTPCGALWDMFGWRRVAGDMVAKMMTSVDIISLNLICSAPTATGSHDVARSWCWQLQPQILQER